MSLLQCSFSVIIPAKNRGGIPLPIPSPKKMYYQKKVWTRRFQRVYQQFVQLVADEKRYADPALSANTVAQLMHLSPTYVTTLLKAETGDSLHVLIAKVRVREACRMLRHARCAAWSTEEIGLRCGFASRQVFHKTFKRHTGITPLQFRRMTDEMYRQYLQHPPEGVAGLAVSSGVSDNKYP